jgi:hypothetical protein
VSNPRVRVLAVATVGAATISWWPAFTLGAYQTRVLCVRPSGVLVAVVAA